jgi:hypothetical protein
MILEAFKIEPLMFYEDKEEFKKEYFKILGKENLNFFADCERKLIKFGSLIKRIHDFEINEYEKLVLVYYSIWKDDKSRLDNFYLINKLKKCLSINSWSINDYKTKEIGDYNYKNWVKRYYVNEVFRNNISSTPMREEKVK